MSKTTFAFNQSKLVDLLNENSLVSQMTISWQMVKDGAPDFPINWTIKHPDMTWTSKSEDVILHHPDYIIHFWTPEGETLGMTMKVVKKGEEDPIFEMSGIGIFLQQEQPGYLG